MKRVLLTLVCCLFLSAGISQIRISSVDPDEWLKKNFSGQGIVIGNIKHHGNRISMASFTGFGKVLELPKGLILSSGNAFSASGANTVPNISTTFNGMDEPETDADLSPLLKEKLYDISSVEFDFVPYNNSLKFNYQFGSDEYPEYVGTPFNDIFAFFISDGVTTKNIALVPEKNIPVSINNINAKSEAKYFIDNNIFSQEEKREQPKKVKVQRSFFASIWYGIKSIFASSDEEDYEVAYVKTDPELQKKVGPDLYRNLQYDGITKKLTAQTYVEPLKKYHLKIIIADASDNIFDSGVFIEDKSLTSVRDSLQPGYINYADLSGIIDAKQILQGKKMEDLLPDTLLINNGLIYFDFDHADIKPSEESKLQGLAQMYKEVRDKYDLRVIGHTDSIGNMDYNMDLSKRRNESVIGYLTKIVDPAPQIAMLDKAFLEPAATNSTTEGRSLNRRVKVVFVKRK
ncbi:OmpA family protein [Pedobacter sp. HMF7647]|uniref:OmpA family protein n=1 Tax=Hufsiella arboris TaxID=2695275 RepID=A0A7K1YB08_9SPHI|nr:OmpA family protein [Hufsiella arboris]MXV51620.1 OmpA family protein [Hufsiella arboris]